MNFIKSFLSCRQTSKGTKYFLSNSQVGALAVIGIASAFTIFGATVTAPAFAVFSVGALVSIFTGIGLNIADEKYAWTTSLQEKVNEIQASFKFKIETVEEGPKESLEEFLDYLYRGFDYFIYTGGYSVPYSKPY